MKANKTNETTAIAKVDNSVFAIGAPSDVVTVRDTTTTDSVTLFNAINGTSTKVKDVLGVELEVNNIVITSVNVAKEFGDEDGEKECKPCVNFFTTDGQKIASISNGIIRGVKALYASGMLPREDAPIKIMFKTVETKNGTAHTFDLCH